MKIFRTAFEAGKRFPGSVAALGKFDAVHIGHRELLRAARARADALGAALVVLTFDPQPGELVGLPSARPLLCVAERMAMLRRLGVDAVALVPFDEALACLSPEAFARDVLALQLKPAAVVVGEDFCFGRDAAGRVRTLEELGEQLGFRVHSVRLIRRNGRKVTTERVRALLEADRRGKVEQLLGRRLARAPKSPPSP